MAALYIWQHNRKDLHIYTIIAHARYLQFLRTIILFTIIIMTELRFRIHVHHTCFTQLFHIL